MTGKTSLFDDVRSLSPKFPLLWLAVGTFLYFVISTSLLGESQDWQNYNNLFDGLRTSGISAESLERTEIGFKYLAIWLISLSFSNTAIYATIAAGSIALKAAALSSLSRSRAVLLFAIMFYLLSVAPLHEMTQIRAAVATTFLFLAYVFLLSSRYLSSLFIGVAAVFFHISAVVILPLLFAVFVFERGGLILTRVRTALLGLLTFALVSSAVMLVLLYLEDLVLVVEIYLEEGFGDEQVNPLSSTVILNILMIATAFWRWSGLSQNMRYIVVFQVYGLAIFYATLEFQVVAFRLSELVQAFWVLFIVDGLGRSDVVLRGFTAVFATVGMMGYGYIYIFSGNFFL
jgi:hypothetical protein